MRFLLSTNLIYTNAPNNLKAICMVLFVEVIISWLRFYMFALCMLLFFVSIYSLLIHHFFISQFNVEYDELLIHYAMASGFIPNILVRSLLLIRRLVKQNRHPRLRFFFWFLRFPSLPSPHWCKLLLRGVWARIALSLRTLEIRHYSSYHIGVSIPSSWFYYIPAIMAMERPSRHPFSRHRWVPKVRSAQCNGRVTIGNDEVCSGVFAKSDWRIA